jgi:hypothetical protein
MKLLVINSTRQAEGIAVPALALPGTKIICRPAVSMLHKYEGRPAVAVPDDDYGIINDTFLHASKIRIFNMVISCLYFKRTTGVIV